MGLMAAPNSAAIMNAVPAAERGAASGIRATGMNAGMVLSMGGFFTLMAIGLASRLPAAPVQRADRGRRLPGRPPRRPRTPRRSGCCSPPSWATTRSRHSCPNPGPGADTAAIYGPDFFPHLISEPFRHGLLIAFSASILMLLIAAGAPR